MVFHSVAFSLDEDGLGMVEESVEDGGSQGAVVVEDLRPVFERRFDVMMMEPCS